MTHITTARVTTDDQQRIVYDRYCNGCDKVIVLAHGFYNSRRAVLFERMARDLSDEYDVMVLDFRGHGDSSGWFDWTAREAGDLVAVLTEARRHYPRVGVVGFSLGAAASLLAAADTSLIDSLIAVSAPSDVRRIDFDLRKMGVMENVVYNIFQEGRIGKGVRPGKPWLKKVRPLDVVSELRCPVYFLHGGNDWLIKPWHSQRLFEQASGIKKLDILEDATHAEFMYRRNPPLLICKFKEWFSETLH